MSQQTSLIDYACKMLNLLSDYSVSTESHPIPKDLLSVGESIAVSFLLGPSGITPKMRKDSQSESQMHDTTAQASSASSILGAYGSATIESVGGTRRMSLDTEVASAIPHRLLYSSRPDMHSNPQRSNSYSAFLNRRRASIATQSSASEAASPSSIFINRDTAYRPFSSLKQMPSLTLPPSIFDTQHPPVVEAVVVEYPNVSIESSMNTDRLTFDIYYKLSKDANTTWNHHVTLNIITIAAFVLNVQQQIPHLQAEDRVAYLLSQHMVSKLASPSDEEVFAAFVSWLHIYILFVGGTQWTTNGETWITAGDFKFPLLEQLSSPQTFEGLTPADHMFSYPYMMYADTCLELMRVALAPEYSTWCMYAIGGGWPALMYHGSNTDVVDTLFATIHGFTSLITCGFHTMKVENARLKESYDGLAARVQFIEQQMGSGV